jgi:hypothetical protein
MQSVRIQADWSPIIKVPALSCNRPATHLQSSASKFFRRPTLLNPKTIKADVMRKSFTILTAIIVCALMVAGATARTETSDTQSGAPAPSLGLPVIELNQRIAEARQLLQERATISGDSVRLAALNATNGELTTIPLSKDEFLTKDADIQATTTAGDKVRVHIIRANGVNTAVTISDATTNEALLPLVVQFPIVRNDAITEVAYYTSVHPALLSPELSSNGQSYIRTMLEQAASKLAEQGVVIPSDIVDVAEHLCVVEHTDHKRFMTENAGELLPEILALYGLNKRDTFRYSVSTAGAGGMIQMIPKTYEAIRQTHPEAALNADFVSGMRDHSNALKAMLLYMNDTWDGLSRSSEVQGALSSGIASKPELLAAGYNSNPARLPRYLKDGGAAWRNLIPAETQMYLAIYSSVDKNLELTSASATAGQSTELALSVAAPKPLPILSWLRASLVTAMFR